MADCIIFETMDMSKAPTQKPFGFWADRPVRWKVEQMRRPRPACGVSDVRVGNRR